MGITGMKWGNKTNPDEGKEYKMTDNERKLYEELNGTKEDVINELLVFGCSEREANDIAINAMQCCLNIKSEVDLYKFTSNYNIKAVAYAYAEFSKTIFAYLLETEDGIEG